MVHAQIFVLNTTAAYIFSVQVFRQHLIVGSGWRDVAIVSVVVKCLSYLSFPV